MNAKTAPNSKSPEEIAREKLRDNLSLLSAESFSASALVYTHGDTLSLEETVAVNAIVIGAIEIVFLSLRDTRSVAKQSQDFY